MLKRSEVINKSFSIFQPFTRSNNEERLVKGIASKEEVDSYGDIVLFDAMEKAFPDYLGKKKENGNFTYGNIREMHGSKAAGKVVSFSMDKIKRETHIEVKVVDDQAWKKVQEDVYAGFSIGGKIMEADPIEEEFESDDGEKITRTTGWTITKIKLIEISLVDRPACPSALIDSYKKASQDGNFVPDIVLGSDSDTDNQFDLVKFLKTLTINNKTMNFKKLWATLVKQFNKDGISLEDIEKNDETVKMTASDIHALLKSIAEATFNEVNKNEEEEDDNEEEEEDNESDEEDEETNEEEETNEDDEEEDDTEKSEISKVLDVVTSITEELSKVQKDNAKMAKQIKVMAKATSTQGEGEDKEPTEEEKEEALFKGTVL